MYLYPKVSLFNNILKGPSIYYLCPGLIECHVRNESNSYKSEARTLNHKVTWHDLVMVVWKSSLKDIINNQSLNIIYNKYISLYCTSYNRKNDPAVSNEKLKLVWDQRKIFPTLAITATGMRFGMISEFSKKWTMQREVERIVIWWGMWKNCSKFFWCIKSKKCFKYGWLNDESKINYSRPAFVETLLKIMEISNSHRIKIN